MAKAQFCLKKADYRHNANGVIAGLNGDPLHLRAVPYTIMDENCWTCIFNDLMMTSGRPLLDSSC